jgi:hypothetical protein
MIGTGARVNCRVAVTTAASVTSTVKVEVVGVWALGGGRLDVDTDRDGRVTHVAAPAGMRAELG